MAALSASNSEIEPLTLESAVTCQHLPPVSSLLAELVSNLDAAGSNQQARTTMLRYVRVLVFFLNNQSNPASGGGGEEGW